MRLLFISVGAVVFTAALLLMTHFWGLSQIYPIYSHPFLEAPRPWYGAHVVDVTSADELTKKI